ncbi:hypothetical protein DSM104329_02948 [Capillimicrobium parvum]|uniref:Integrase catalytic domain-containing protein n=1 Tax=Capillimicrobium parvum TaxID=2884022 RepID=A0A9E6XY00_9ACTN|nr:hypothetical protein DSM104329_02948 [Capillimicrobium parvum]
MAVPSSRWTDFALATLATPADEATGPPPTKFYALRDNLPDHVWAIDSQFDQAVDDRAIKLLNVVDGFTREALAMEVATSITVDHTVRVFARLARERGAPGHVRCDTGPSSPHLPSRTRAAVVGMITTP